MPGTLMFEGSLQARSIYLAAVGYTLDFDGCRFEPVAELPVTLRCRGQAQPTSKEVVYEVFVDELVGGPRPTLYADLLGTVDGLKAFHCRRMALALVPAYPLDAGRVPWTPPPSDRPVAVVEGFPFDHASLLACAWGSPAASFGPLYASLPPERRLPRLPSPPYHFMSRIAKVTGALGGMEVGSTVDAEYDVPDDAWYFGREGYETTVCHDGQEGLRKAQVMLPDVILLDLMLPGMNGLDVCRELRSGERTREIPIIMMTAKTEETDQVVGYSMGADDYVPKPFSNKVLLHKVKALLRRVAGQSDPGDVSEHLGVKIDRVRHRVTFGEEKLDLTPTEFRLIECLVRQPGRAFSRAQLMDASIGEGSIVLERTIDVHIKTLRKKLAEAGGEGELIETVRGVGYRFREGKGEGN
jgi:two-component system phosphate regulon response regulator PhoB